jgi:hypothetical protein
MVIEGGADLSKPVELVEIDGVLGKSCTKCKMWQPLDNYHNRKTASDGRKPRCKECCREDKGAKKRILRTELTQVDGVLGKECGICRTWIPLDNFADRKGGLGGKRSDCIECERKRNLQYFYDHHEERRLYGINYNKENREKLTEKLRKWYRDNPDKVAANNHRRRARKLSLPDDFTDEDMRKIYEEFGGCALTGSDDVQWDHVIPLSTGYGGTTAKNMIPLRADLNLSKNDGNIFVWFERNKERFSLCQNKFNNLIDYLANMNGMSVDDYRSFVYGCFENKVEVI